MANQFRPHADGSVEITLTKGKSAFVDATDLDKIVAGRWHAHDSRNNWYVKGTIAGRRVILHRFLLDAPSHLIVDHIDGDGMNNRRSNLRLATESENHCNRKRAHANNATGVLGICWRPDRKRYRVRVQYKGVTYQGGNFATFDDAVAAHRELAQQLHGQFAAYNGALAAPQAKGGM